jgi:hypothetical protein
MDFYNIYNFLTNIIFFIFVFSSIIKNILFFTTYTDFFINVIQTTVFAFIWPLFALYFLFTLIIYHPYYNIY